MRLVLARLVAEDSSLNFRIDEESGQTILSGANELHLDWAVDRVRGELREDLSTGAPQVAYREAIARTVEHEHIHRKQSGGSSQFARIKFKIEHSDPDEENRVLGDASGHLPTNFLEAVYSGVREVLRSGPMIGFPLVGVTFTLLDGAYHDTDSSVAAFTIAGRVGFKEAIERAAPRVLEPIMRCEVVAPENCIGDVIGDLNSRRARIIGTGERRTMHLVDAMVPLASMFGYVNSLRAISRGLGQYVITFDHYERVPHSVDPDDRFRPAMAMRA